MSFYGLSFTFDGVSCEELGYMLYDFNNTNQQESSFSKGYVIEADRIPRSHKSLYYGGYHKSPLEFDLVFGVGQSASSSGRPIDREQMAITAAWLTEKDGYRRLAIDQPDMAKYYYNCIITDLKTLEYSGNKWAFSCRVTCDSPYAYMYPKSFKYTSNGITNVVLRSESTTNEPYAPTKTIITVKGGTEVSIINHDDHDRTTSFKGLSTSDTKLELYGHSQNIVSSSGLNVYEHFNFKFPRLLRGDNHLEITGNCDVEFVCEFPANIGG